MIEPYIRSSSNKYISPEEGDIEAGYWKLDLSRKRGVKIDLELNKWYMSRYRAK